MNGPIVSPENIEPTAKQRSEFPHLFAFWLTIIFVDFLVIWFLWDPASRLFTAFFGRVRQVDREVMGQHSSDSDDTHTLGSHFNSWMTTPYRQQPQENWDDSSDAGTGQSQQSNELPQFKIDSSDPGKQE